MKTICNAAKELPGISIKDWKPKDKDYKQELRRINIRYD